MSPVTPTPGLTTTSAVAPKGSAGVSTDDATAPAAMPKEVATAVSNPGHTTGHTTGLTTDSQAVCVPNLSCGKPVPGPDEWRALERRASSFRL
jgi:hypothetical protein